MNFQEFLTTPTGQWLGVFSTVLAILFIVLRGLISYVYGKEGVTNG